MPLNIITYERSGFMCQISEKSIKKSDMRAKGLSDAFMFLKIKTKTTEPSCPA